MHNLYSTSTTLIIISLILLLIALFVTIVAYRDLSSNVIVSPATDIGYVKGVLIFLIIVEVIMILVSLWGLVKVRTSNMGGIFGFIIGLILSIVVVILNSISINKTIYSEFPFVVKTLAFTVVFIPAVFLMLVASVWSKPSVSSAGFIKKAIKSTQDELNKMKMDQPKQGQFYETSEIYVQQSDLQPVPSPVQQVQVPAQQRVAVSKNTETIYTTATSNPQNKTYVVTPTKSRTVVVQQE